ncbi:MAG TPA: C40 family peptidase [Puia sp.]|nr:C40 family peptidase [Puia sp.]
MSPAICCVPVSPLRAEPSHRSEMVSQLLFGEHAGILEQSGRDWCRVRGRFDGYEGWCQPSHLVEVGESGKDGHELTRDWVTGIEYNGIPMQVPMGSLIPGLTARGARWGPDDIRYSGQLWDPLSASRNPSDIRKLTGRFLNTAYLWGGKSIFGIDCSGFSQTVFKFLGIPLLRDAALQAGQGESVGFLEETRTGDLAFFDNDEGRITHVGVLLSPQEIIHASGKVRIDRIDNLGIVNADTNQRTHRLRLIKRVLVQE